jgi:aspartate kinase
MLVLKFGGTSVGSPERMKHVAELIIKCSSGMIVLSAVSGTTNTLVNICEAYTQSKKEIAIEKADALYHQYLKFIDGLYLHETTRSDARQIIQEQVHFIKSFAEDVFTQHEEKSILALGELMSTALFHLYLSENGIGCALIPALEFMRIDEDGEPVMDFIEKNLKMLLQKNHGKKLFLTQGYICRNAFGNTDNLKRGGSDYTASIIGAVLRSPEIQIWTDIDGMHNNDPRIVTGTQPVPRLSFDEAAELAYFGAKILHPQSILPARKFNIPVRLLNTMSPEAEGTLITETSGHEPIKAVAAKDGISVINIKSGRMLLAYGFLRNVFEIFERYKTSIDMITTSEVAVSVTIDNTRHLDSVLGELGELGSVTYEKDQCIICVVGDFIHESQGYAFRVLEALRDIPVRMISYGGSKNNISLLIDTSNKKQALQALHKGLFDTVSA